jgi:hypothetical protein
MSTKASHPLRSVTARELHDAIADVRQLVNIAERLGDEKRKLALDELRIELNHNTQNVDTLARRDISRVITTVESRVRERLRSLDFVLQELNLAFNDQALGRQRDSQRIALLQARLADLEARTFAGRCRRVARNWRAFVAELGGPFVDPDGDDALDPQLIDELTELYRPPASLSPVRQDARHAR